MESLLRKRGVTFLTSTRVDDMVLDASRKRIVAVRTSQGEIEADAFVMAMGAANASHAQKAGILICRFIR